MMLQKPFISDTCWSVDPAQATTQKISRRENDILKQAFYDSSHLPAHVRWLPATALVVSK